MAAPLRQGVSALVLLSSQKLSTSSSSLRTISSWSLHRVCASNQNILQISQSWNDTQIRHGSFITHMKAQDLWAGVVGVSNAGRKRGRGKRVGRKKVTDLNRGQLMGTGKANVVWPGLNAPIIKGRELMQRKQLPPNPDYQNQLVKIRDELSRIRYPRLEPLLRGWSGKRFPGQSVGPPDPVADYVFEGFDTKVLEFKLVTNMTGTLGRKQRFTAFVVTGNKNGIVGLGLGKSQNGKAAIRVAKNKAAQRLRYVDRFEDHTVFHNMFTKYHRTKIIIHKKEKGYGLRCHRALRTMCELIGIKDLHCKVEGSIGNVQNVCKGFIETLTNQETHQQLSDRVGYHIVEMRPERGNLPIVVASPTDGIVETQPLKDEEEDLESDFDRLYYDGKVEYIKPRKKWFYEGSRSYRKKVSVEHKRRNQTEVQLLRRAGLADI